MKGMPVTIKPDVCIIGAGSGGLTMAKNCSQFGLNVVLIEKGKMGGDCLNYGCVPSKALIAAAKRAQSHRKTDFKGISGHEPEIDFAAVKDHVDETIAMIAPHDSQSHLESLGVTVLRGSPYFTGKASLEVVLHNAENTPVDAGQAVLDDPSQSQQHQPLMLAKEGSAANHHGPTKTAAVTTMTIQARYYVICTGSHAALPSSVPGFDSSRSFTNETIFDLREKPKHLLIIGGGPIGIEMAQAHLRLGCRVSVLQRNKTILPKDDPKCVAILKRCLLDEGLEIYEGVQLKRIAYSSEGEEVVSVTVHKDNEVLVLRGSHLFVATGRVPNVEGLELEAASVQFSKERGILVDQYLKTTNKKIWSIGDVSGGPQFTHVAGYQAGVIIKQICFRLFWTKVDYKALPWVTYSDPEVAQVGLTEAEAMQKHGKENIRVAEFSMESNDRAIAERTHSVGLYRAVTDQKGLILGCSIVGQSAGELLATWVHAITCKQHISAMFATTFPYPTLSEGNMYTAMKWHEPKLYGAGYRKMVKFLQKFPLV